MGLYNFQERFVPFIKDGSKTGTIRTIRKYPQKVGKPMHLFTGLRTKHTKRIIDAPVCKQVNTLFLMPDGNVDIQPSGFTAIDAQMHLEWLIFHSNKKETKKNIT